MSQGRARIGINCGDRRNIVVTVAVLGCAIFILGFFIFIAKLIHWIALHIVDINPLVLGAALCAFGCAIFIAAIMLGWRNEL